MVYNWAMSTPYRIISADSHVNPSPAIYAERLPREYRDRAPKVFEKGGEEVAVFEGREEKFEMLASVAGMGYENYKADAKSYQEGRAGGYDAKARLVDMDTDGIQADVLFGSGSGGGVRLKTEDRPFRFALMQAYNDWLGDYCKVAPGRLIGIAEIPHWDVELAVGEARRARKMGLRGVAIPAIPTIAPGDRSYLDRVYEPLWSALEELEMPAHMHLGTRPVTAGIDRNFFVRLSTNKAVMAEPIASMLFSGVLERHPKLKVVSVESGVGWMAFLVPWMDNVYERHRHWTKLRLPEKPSHYFQRQVRATFIEDPVGVRERRTIGISVIMWSNDYPHSDSTWPHSRKAIDEQFAGVPAADRDAMVYGNAAALYGVK